MERLETKKSWLWAACQAGQKRLSGRQALRWLKLLQGIKAAFGETRLGESGRLGGGGGRLPPHKRCHAGGHGRHL